MTTTADEISPEFLLDRRTELERLQGVLRNEPERVAADRLARVELALKWLVSGYYGRCGICGGHLDEALLRQFPERLVCAACTRPTTRRDGAPITAVPW